MISKKVEAALNNQISLEGQSSQFYLAMASWAENKGFGGTCEFYTDKQTRREYIC